MSVLLMKAFFLLDFHKDNILPYLAYALPWNDVLAFPSPKAAEMPRSWYNERGEAVDRTIKLYINGTSQTFAGTCIDDFFLF